MTVNWKTEELLDRVLADLDDTRAQLVAARRPSAPSETQMSDDTFNPSQIADAPVVAVVEGVYIAKAPNGNLLLATVRTMQQAGEHIVISANALAALLRASAPSPVPTMRGHE